MGLRDADLPPILDTSEHNLVSDFFVPMLQASTRYDRGVGFFSSGWLRAHAQGMQAFAENGGRARWITSPVLSESDWNALQEGDEARTDETLREVLFHRIDDLAKALREDTLTALAWLIADGVLDFRLALPKSKLDRGNFHVKFGLFEDDHGDRVSFNGSYNDSIQGIRNYESINVFRSWDVTASYVDDAAVRFQRLWENEDPNVQAYTLPESARRQILQLRTEDRPYALPESYTYPTGTPTDAVSVPGKSIELWDHQDEAIQAWFDNGCVGLLNMATGSGKTVTALLAAEQRPDLNLLVIAVPTKNLVDQWDEELRSVTVFPDPILVYESAAIWQDRLFRRLRVGHRKDWPQPLTVIGSMASLSGDRFQSVLEDAGLPERAMLIVDEVHNVGAPLGTRQN